MDIDNWIAAVLALRKAKRVVVFTGAGISAESGIPTFRDADGFWQRFPPELYATWNGLLTTVVTQPLSVAEFVLNVIEPVAKAEPNSGHQAIVRMEQRVKTTVITQNIDGLHQSAGSSEVLEVHGSLLEVSDTSAGKLVRRFERKDLMRIADCLHQYTSKKQSAETLILELQQQYPFDWMGRHRPNVVLFGDGLPEAVWAKACEAVEECDVLLSVGTSGAVYPAAMLPDNAKAAGTLVVTIDPQPRSGCWLEGDAGTVLPKLIHDTFEIQN